MKHEKSCGCIIIEDKKVLLIKQTNGIWGFPKGHVEENETELQTAEREVKEETKKEEVVKEIPQTNIDVKIDETKRYTMNYITDRGASKEVVLFLARKIGGNLSRQESEISQIEWLGFDDAISRLSYKNTKDLFKKVVSQL